jgi:hypothetical protein
VPLKSIHRITRAFDDDDEGKGDEGFAFELSRCWVSSSLAASKNLNRLHRQERKVCRVQ